MGLISEVINGDCAIRKELFEQKLINYSGHINGSQGFGSQKEKTVHSFLKNFYSSDSDYEEVMLDGFICDICDSRDIIEIQSKYFYRLKDKLNHLLDAHLIMVVFPVSYRKYIEWLDPDSGEVVSIKKSPQKKDIYDFLPEAYGIRELLLNNNLKFCIFLLETVETKLLDGYGKDKKLKATKFDRRPEKYVREFFINDIKDYYMFVPAELDEFDRKMYAKATGLNLSDASTALTLLTQLGVIEHFETRNRKYIYRIKEL